MKNLFQFLEEDTVAENDPWFACLQNAVKAMENEKEARSKMTLSGEWLAHSENPRVRCFPRGFRDLY